MSLASRERKETDRKTTWLPKSWGVRFTIAVTGAFVSWWVQIRWLNHLDLPGVSTLNERLWQMAPIFLLQAVSIFFSVWAVILFFKGLGRLGKVGNILSILLGLAFSVFVWNALSNDWFKPGSSGSLKWLFWIAPVAFVLLYPLPIMWMKRRAVAFAMHGDYERALQISKFWLRSRVYGRSFRGWILLQAGQYSQAQALLKDSAFDEKGRPRLTNVNLYFYSIVLMNQDKNAEAQELLEAAIRVPQKQDYFHFGLAECLLTQSKEASRACELVEQVISKLKRQPNQAEVRTFMALCLALQAWALASCGRRADAEAGLTDAFAESGTFDKDDLAGLLQLKGETLQALGDRALADAAFQQALELFPFGSIGMLARKKLAELGENSSR